MIWRMNTQLQTTRYTGPNISGHTTLETTNVQITRNESLVVSLQDPRLGVGRSGVRRVKVRWLELNTLYVGGPLFGDGSTRTFSPTFTDVVLESFRLFQLLRNERSEPSPTTTTVNSTKTKYDVRLLDVSTYLLLREGVPDLSGFVGARVTRVTSLFSCGPFNRNLIYLVQQVIYLLQTFVRLDHFGELTTDTTPTQTKVQYTRYETTSVKSKV